MFTLLNKFIKKNSVLMVFVIVFMASNIKAQVNYCPTVPATTPGSCSSQLGYQTKATGLYTLAGGKLSIASNESATAFGNSTTASGKYAFVWGDQSVASGEASSAFGYMSNAIGKYSFAAGYQSTANGIYSIALGFRANTSAANSTLAVAIGESAYSASQAYSFGQQAKASASQSVAIGRFVETTSSGAIVLGSSTDLGPLVNTIPNSLMIGFNSTKPSLFVGSSPDYQSSGNIGIGTSDPKAKVHVLSNAGENAILYLQNRSFIGSYYAAIQLGNEYHGIIANPTQGLIFKSQNNYLFSDGNVGIGTSAPASKLQVEGNTLLNGNLQVGQSGKRVVSKIWGKVGIGTDNPLTDLQVNGSMSVGYESNLPSEDKSLIVSGKVGIGTFSPTEALEVKGKIKTNQLQLTTGYMNGYILLSDENGNAQWVNPANVSTVWQLNGNNVTVDNNKKVGIGIATPAELLHVAGNMLLTGSIKGGHNDWQSLNLYGNSSEDDGAYMYIGNSSSGSASIKFFARGESGRLEFHNQNMQVMSIRGDNNVYIGNPTDNSDLHVMGEITAHVVRVNTTSWWDGVFDNNYRLMPLNEVELYVKQNKHLPDLPTEAEVKADGMDVAQMNALLLKKVEELTLYVIELEKRVNELSK